MKILSSVKEFHTMNWKIAQTQGGGNVSNLFGTFFKSEEDNVDYDNVILNDIKISHQQVLDRD